MSDQVLVEGVNIGKLPDIFSLLKNDKEILKIRSDGDLNDDYKELYTRMEKSLNSLRDLYIDQVVEGVVMSKNDKEIQIDFGYKDYIYVETPKGGISENVKIGDTIQVLITELSDNPFLIKGSITELIKANVHNKLKEYFSENKFLISKVKSTIPAGYMMDIYMDDVTIEAFMPNTLADVNKLSDPESILGVTMNVMLETLQQERGVYVVSRRKYLKTLIPQEIKKLKYNTVYTGKVTGTTPFGIFVQFGPGEDKCLTGMIHKVNVNKEWQNKWQLIIPGMEIDFYVREISKKNNRIILTQILRESLWDKIKVGKSLDGKVRDVKNFGALIELDPETTGLIQTTYIKKSGVNLTKGDEIKVVVISVIKDDRKIYLDIYKNRKN